MCSTRRLVTSTLSAGQASSSSRTRRRGIRHLLEIVQEQERRATAAQVVGNGLHQRVIAALAHADGQGDGRCHQPRVGNRRQVHERDAAIEEVGQIGGDLDGEPRFAGPARAGQRQQPDVGIEQQAVDSRELAGSSDHRRALRRKIVVRVPRPAGGGAQADALGEHRASLVSSASTSSAEGRAAALLSSMRQQEPLEEGGRPGHLRAGLGVARDVMACSVPRVDSDSNGCSAGGELVEHDAQREDVARRSSPSRRAPVRATCSAACRG